MQVLNVKIQDVYTLCYPQTLTAFTPKLLQAKIVIYFNFNSNLIHHPVRTGPDSKAVVFN